MSCHDKTKLENIVFLRNIDNYVLGNILEMNLENQLEFILCPSKLTVYTIKSVSIMNTTNFEHSHMPKFQ